MAYCRLLDVRIDSCGPDHELFCDHGVACQEQRVFPVNQGCIDIAEQDTNRGVRTIGRDRVKRLVFVVCCFATQDCAHGQVLTSGNDVAIIACGAMVNEALFAVGELSKKGISVRLINMHTINPLDKDTILKAAEETRGIVVCEEHSVIGGLASGVDEVVAENHPTKVVRLGIRNRFGQSGESVDLLKEYKLTSVDIEKAVSSILS